MNMQPTFPYARQPLASQLSRCFLIALSLFVILPTLTASADDLRVMSFNLRFGTANDGENHWNNRKEFLAETIVAFNPDLLGTQETIAFQKEFLAEQLPAYTGIGVGRDDGKPTGGEMTALFFKTERFELLDEGHFWLSESPEIPGSKSWDTSLTRMCSWVKLRDRSTPQRPILFMNTHFDHRGPQARLESARLLRQKAKELGADCDVVLTGDFNAAVNSPPYEALFMKSADEVSFVDTYAVAGPKDDLGEATFSGFRAETISGSRIDWIAVRGNWNVRSAAIDRTARDGRTPSDHYPVTAIIAQTKSE